jgi:hypothetical protein
MKCAPHHRDSGRDPPHSQPPLTLSVSLSVSDPSSTITITLIMPKSFLITNRRYELTPPPPPDTVLALVPAAFGYVFPGDVQEEAEDLSVPKKQPLESPVSQRKASALTPCSDADEISHLTFQHVSYQ